jgi:GNAT superfamily N-acetyltransferase
VEIVDASRAPYLELARELVVEYGTAIAHVAGPSLTHQRFDDEISALPGKYAPPRGRLLVALDGNAALGSIALRPLPELGADVCELKRMYVRPAARGRGVGRALLERLVAEARAAGYRMIKLDTDTHAIFAAAIRLYRAFGFVECERYNSDPDPRTLWFELAL